MDKELLREVILNTIASIAPDAMTSGTVLHFTKARGFPHLDSITLAAELDYLEQKKLLESKRGELAAGVVHWKLAAAGREYLEAKGILPS